MYKYIASHRLVVANCCSPLAPGASLGRFSIRMRELLRAVLSLVAAAAVAPTLAAAAAWSDRVSSALTPVESHAIFQVRSIHHTL